MPSPRLVAPDHHPRAYYHCMSRVVDGRFIFGPDERMQFLKLLREYSEFCQIRVLTFAIMSNHFHLLLEVPRPPESMPTAEETLTALAKLSSTQGHESFRQQLEFLRSHHDQERELALLSRIHARRWNLSAFMQVLKQRFSRWYNLRMGRKGTLYEARFKSVLVEGPGQALATIAAYIDLNPVRAGVTNSAQDANWTGCRLASRGDAVALQGIQGIVRSLDGGLELSPGDALTRYRAHLSLRSINADDSAGAAPLASPLRHPRVRLEILRALKDGDLVTPNEYLQVRVRPFHDGVILGTRAFVNEIFHANRRRFGPRRTSGARQLPRWPGRSLFTLRRLRLRVFG